MQFYLILTAYCPETLPNYSFQEKKYWLVEIEEEKQFFLLQTRVSRWSYYPPMPTPLPVTVIIPSGPQVFPNQGF